MWWAEDATTDVFATRVFHVIDTESGQSGSSLWRDIEGLPLMVAVHSGAQGDENHATRLVQAKIDWLIARIAEDTPPNDQPELTTYSAEPAVFDPETTHCRGPLDASVFVTNQCGDAVADSVDVLFLLGEPSTPQISIILDTASVGPLVPGEGNQANAAVNAEIPVEVDDGIYELRWVIDPGNAHFERDENNNDGTLGGEEITITRRPPSYPPVQDVTIDCGGGYTGPQPALVDPVCMNPVTWSLDEGPEGMTINPMGVVNWPAPTVGTHTIKIRASNSGGFATRTWHLIVRALVPVVIPPPDETIDCCEPYSSPVPMLTNPVCMSPPHAPAVWALDAGPGGMGINPTTGQVGWGGVTGTDHLVQIAAANSRGVGGAGYSLTVENDCNENGVADDTEPDADGDGVIDACDNCPADSNEDQKDTDGDGDGDECDDDDDGDGIPDAEDNCPGDPNPGQEDGDGDGVGDDCDNCPGEDNPGQGDIDDDGDGDDCDDDMDGDGVDNPDDNCPPVPNPQQGDVPFPETIVPFTDDALHWATAVDVDWVRGELTHVSQYTTNGSGSASDATQLDDPVAPAPGFGFFYLISLGGDCTAASWQSSIGAEPQRDAALP
ncbi:MAG: hypothetical protein GY716_20000 [bacterium]|nr:hypothetical protein [bacterium]